jgi:hypothetical protein
MSHERKHTAGPWTYRPAPHCDIVTAYNNPDQWSEEDDQGPVRIISTYGAMGGNDSTADATLMAAAPDLLSALEQALLCMKSEGFGEMSWCGPARAAISKATGGNANES